MKTSRLNFRLRAFGMLFCFSCFTPFFLLGQTASNGDEAEARRVSYQKVDASVSPKGMHPEQYNFQDFSGSRHVAVEEKFSQEALRELKEQTPEEFHDHPEFGKVPHNAQCEECVELIQKRGASRRVYINVDNPSRKYVQQSYGRLHYMDKEGRFRSLNNELVPHPEKEGLYHAPHQKLTTRLNTKTGFSSIEMINGERFRFNGDLRLFYKEEGQEKALGKIDDQEIQVGSDGSTTEEAWKNIRRTQVFKEAGIKTSFTIEERPDYLEDKGQLIFEDRIELPAGYRIRPDRRYGKETENGWWIGHLVVEDASGDTVLQWRAISIKEKDKGPRNGHVTGAYKLIQEGNTWKIRMRTDMQKVRSKGLGFPLVVDPLVTGSNTYSTGSKLAYEYSQDVSGTDCWDDGYCSYTMSVTVPGQSTITDAYFDMEYVAECPAFGSTCYIKDDGAIDIYGPCGRSPDTSDLSVKWTCQDGMAGTCSGTDLAAYGTVDCVSPSCPDHNISFEMRTYNCRNEDLVSGCGDMTAPTTHLYSPDNSWTMTVEAHTLESASSPTSTNGTTICEGESTDLEAYAQYGVPPYTYSWSPVGVTGNPITVSPTSTTKYKVTITDDCGNSVKDSITINVDPKPTVSAGNDTTICQGDNAYLDGSYGGSASSITWSTAGDGSFSSTTDPNATYTPGPNDESNGSVELTITTDDPSGPCTSVSDSMIVTIEPAPTVSAGSNATICEGNSYTLNGSYGGSATGLSWSTSGDGTFSSTTDPSATYTPGSNDISSGSVTLTATSTGGCDVVSDNMTLTIDPAATVSAGSDTSICKGDVASLDGSYGGGASSITWSTAGDGSFSSTSDPKATYTPGPNDESSGSVTLTITTDDPAGPCPSVSDNMTLTIDTLPVVSFSGLSGPYCEDAAPDTLTGSEAPSGSFSGSGVTDLGSGEGEFDPASVGPGTYDVYYSYTDGNSCSNTDTQSVDVVSLPTVNFSGLSAGYCGNATGDTLVGNQAPNGSFSGNGVTDLGSGEGYFDPTAVSPGTHEVYYSYTDGNGCTNIDTQTVDVFDPPVLDSSNVTITNSTCGNSDGKIENLAVNGGSSPFTYEWVNGSGTVVGNSLDLTGVPAGNYTINVSDANGCVDTLGVFTVSDIGGPTVSTAPDSTICEGDSVPLGGNPTATGGTTPYSYSWSNGASLDNDTIADPNAGPSSTTSYTVTVTDANGCNGSDNVTITVNTPATVNAGPDTSICANDTVMLDGSYGGGASSVTWSSSGDGGFGSPGDTISTYIPGSADTSSGSATLTLSTDDPAGPCPAVMDSLLASFMDLPQPDPQEPTICKGDTVEIGVGVGASHLWNTGATSDSITVSPASDSTYWVQVTGSNTCSVLDSVQVLVDTPKSVLASVDSLELQAGASKDVNVTDNDSGGPFAVNEVDAPGKGSLDGPISGVFTYHSNVSEEAVSDSFVYRICDAACKRSCDSATVYVTVTFEETEELFIPNGVSANADGYNDVFHIDGLEAYPQNSLKIFNRWGEQLYSAAPYKNDWKGEGKNGKVLEGTYFYILDLGPGNGKKTGYIEFRR